MSDGLSPGTPISRWMTGCPVLSSRVLDSACMSRMVACEKSPRAMLSMASVTIVWSSGVFIIQFVFLPVVSRIEASC